MDGTVNYICSQAGFDRGVLMYTPPSFSVPYNSIVVEQCTDRCSNRTWITNGDRFMFVNCECSNKDSSVLTRGCSVCPYQTLDNRACEFLVQLPGLPPGLTTYTTLNLSDVCILTNIRTLIQYKMIINVNNTFLFSVFRVFVQYLPKQHEPQNGGFDL